MATLIDNWEHLLIEEEATFEMALKVISNGGYQIALVRETNGKLAGMITDSDVRKALLRGISLEGPICSVMNRSPLVVSPEIRETEAQQLMQLNHYLHMPVVDGKGKLVGLHVAQVFRTNQWRKETLVIMAGGRGKRLMPLTEKLPKPMLQIQGRPMLEHIIEHARNDGFQNIVLSVNYLSHVIKDYFGDGSKCSVNITYVEEQCPLGTAGSLTLLPDDRRSEKIVVTNGDLITTVSYAEMVEHASINRVDGLMGIRRQTWQCPFGVIKSQGNKLVEIKEKPVIEQNVNAGIYVINKAILEILEEDTYSDMTDLFTTALENGMNIEVFPLHEQWNDIGRLEDYNKINRRDRQEV